MVYTENGSNFNAIPNAAFRSKSTMQSRRYDILSENDAIRRGLVETLTDGNAVASRPT
jgi:hypothetical protein